MENVNKFPTVGERIRYVRELKDYAQIGVAMGAGITQKALSKIELNQTNPSIYRIYRIAESLDVLCTRLSRRNAGIALIPFSVCLAICSLGCWNGPEGKSVSGNDWYAVFCIAAVTGYLSMQLITRHLIWCGSLARRPGLSGRPCGLPPGQVK